VTNRKNLPAIFLYHMKGQSLYSAVVNNYNWNFAILCIVQGRWRSSPLVYYGNQTFIGFHLKVCLQQFAWKPVLSASVITSTNLPKLYDAVIKWLRMRTGPLSFKTRCCKRRLNLALVFLCLFCVVVRLVWLVNACFCCVRFSFSIPSQEIVLGNVSEMTCFVSSGT